MTALLRWPVQGYCTQAQSPDGAKTRIHHCGGRQVERPYREVQTTATTSTGAG